MHLSLFSDYSVRVLMYGAVRTGYFRLTEVAAAYRISRHHLAKVVNQLSRHGLLETRRGRGGGIRLAKPPAAIRIGPLVRDLETRHPLVECFAPRTNRCCVIGACRLKGVLAGAMEAFYGVLDGYSLADLVSGPEGVAMSRVLLRGRVGAGAGAARGGGG